MQNDTRTPCAGDRLRNCNVICEMYPLSNFPFPCLCPSVDKKNLQNFALFRVGFLLFAWGVPHDNDDDNNNIDVEDYEMHFNVYTQKKRRKENKYLTWRNADSVRIKEAEILNRKTSTLAGGESTCHSSSNSSSTG